jgi:hypothetical protein
MAGRDISRDRWRETLNSFSRRHVGWMVRVEVTGPDGRARVEAIDLPLQGVSTDSERNSRIDVMVGSQRDDHITHEVNDPVAVTIEQTDAGAERALRIRARDGSTTTVEFRNPHRAEGAHP